jgi:hypothetical protein
MLPRLSELLGAPTYAADGSSVGRVKDVRLVQDGRLIEGFGHALRVEWIDVGGRNLGIRLGFERAEIRGPWPLTTIFRALERRASYYDWSEVEDWQPHLVRLKATATPSEPPA